jgi:3',5'-cyclic AMP phosphodiesterase CpdA
LHISDTHFGTEQAPVVEALVGLSERLRPTLVVLSGDVTQRARRRQFAAAAAFVERLAPAPVLTIPGNHDIPLFNLYARWRHPYANYRRVFNGSLQPRWQSADLFVLGVNTTRRSRHTDGEISALQRKQIAAALRCASRSCLRVVAIHQPMHVIETVDETNLIHGAEQAAREWSEAGVDLVLGGHIHLPYVHPLHERYPGLPRNVWTVQAGTAVSRRIRGGIPNSVYLIRYAAAVTERKCTVERFDYDGREGSFSRVCRSDLPLDRNS